MLLRLGLFLCGCVLCVFVALCASADDKEAKPPEFKADVLPIFEAKCLRCHGAQRRGGKLDMRSMEALLTGGVSGPALKKGNSKKSLLIELIHFNEMPPKKETPRVTREELDLLRKWIDAMPAPEGSPREI